MCCVDVCANIGSSIDLLDPWDLSETEVREQLEQMVDG